MKIFNILLISLIIVYSYNAYGIVRNHKIDDQLYIDLAKKYNSVVRVETDNSFGSGVAISKNRIVTSAHNVKFKNNIKVINDYEEILVYDIIYHKDLDIAILKINKNLDNHTDGFYNTKYIGKEFDIVGYGYTGTGLTGASTRDFKKRAGVVRAESFKREFVECPFVSEDDPSMGACAAKGDSGGGVFSQNKLAGIITYVTGEGGDRAGDSTYGDRTGFIPINQVEEWILENL